MGEDYDYNRELARAAFADMLHDSERNKLYYLGLKAAIKKKKCAGEQVHVLDIGEPLSLDWKRQFATSGCWRGRTWTWR